MQNLRAFTRTDFVGMVTLTWPDRPHGDAVWGKDLSENGMFLQTTSPFRVGDTVQLHFTLKNGEVEVAQAEVRWLRRFEPVSVDGTLPGIGVHFVQMPEASRTVLRKFIDASVAAIPSRPVPEIAGTMRMFAAPGAPSMPPPTMPAPDVAVVSPSPRSVSLPPASSLMCDPSAPLAATTPPLTLLTEPPDAASGVEAAVAKSVPPVTAPYPKADAPSAPNAAAPMAANWQGWRFDRVKVAPTGTPLHEEPPAPPSLEDDGVTLAADREVAALPKFEEATWDELGDASPSAGASLEETLRGTLRGSFPEHSQAAGTETLSCDGDADGLPAAFNAYDDVTAPPHAVEESMPHQAAPSIPPSTLADITVPNQHMIQRPLIIRSAEVAAQESEPPRGTDALVPEAADPSMSGPAWSMGKMSSGAISFPPLARDSDDSAPYLVPASQAFPIAQAGDEMLTHSEIAALRPSRRGGFWPKAAIVMVGAGLGVWMGIPGASSGTPDALDETRVVQTVVPPQAVADVERPLASPPRSRLEDTIKKAAALAPALVSTEANAQKAPVKIDAPVKLASAPPPAVTPEKAAPEKATPVRQATTLASAVSPAKPKATGGRHISTTPGAAEVKLNGGDIVSVFGLENPARVVVDLEGAKYPGPIQEDVSANGVKKLRIGKPDKARIRVVVELDGNARPRGIMADKSAGQLSVRWR